MNILRTRVSEVIVDDSTDLSEQPILAPFPFEASVFMTALQSSTAHF
jgi:hypothetical protein